MKRWLVIWFCPGKCGHCCRGIVENEAKVRAIARKYGLPWPASLSIEAGVVTIVEMGANETMAEVVAKLSIATSPALVDDINVM